MKLPLDATDYEPDPRRQPLHIGIPDGRYVYVQDEKLAILVLPDDAPHLHPKVLGHAAPAEYAGDITVRDGKIVDITNCSGTFQFDDADGLLRVANQLRSEGWEFEPDSVRLFSHTIAQRPIILNDEINSAD